MNRLLACVLWLVCSVAAHAETLTGTVIVVIDGDTLLFKPDTYSAARRAFLKVRLVDIDAPETDQPYGEAATRVLKSLTLKQRGELDITAIDHYGRPLGRLAVHGVAVNAELVRRGAAWAATRSDAAMQQLQDQARTARAGLWHARDPVPPWQWRRGRQ